MNIRLFKEDIEIGRGIQELNQIAEADIRSAHHEIGGLRQPSQRTVELCSKIIEAVEADARAWQESMGRALDSDESA